MQQRGLEISPNNIDKLKMLTTKKELESMFLRSLITTTNHEQR